MQYSKGISQGEILIITIKGTFTIGALDNIDRNPSSMTAASSFHGTGISMSQLPTINNPGKERPPVTLPPKGTGHALPEEYATVHPLELDTSKVVVPISLMKEPESCMYSCREAKGKMVVGVFSGKVR